MTKKLIFFTSFALLLLSGSAYALDNINNNQPLPVEKAFQLETKIKNNNTIDASWNIAPDYHLYKDRIHFKLLSPENSKIEKVSKPDGKWEEDDIFGRYQAYYNTVTIPVSLSNITDNNKIKLQIEYQGCSDKNFCYPPQTKIISFNLNNPNSIRTAVDEDKINNTSISQQDKASELLASHNFTLILFGFLGFGLLLAFTPCVLPMIPILSGLIIGHGEKMSTVKAFWLSLTYVLAMSVTYAIAGVVAALLGSSVQAALQNPWVISSFSLIFVLLALSLFGFYELQMPSKLQEKISNISNHQKSGSYLGVAIMGCLATLIASPCVTAPLIGALAYIGNTGDALLGGSALFVMGLGMGIPLIILGTFGGKILPKAGAWMDTIKHLFGVFMLAVAIWMLSRILPGVISLLLWSALALISSVYLGLFNSDIKTGWQKFWKGLGFVLASYGLIMMIGVALGNTDPLHPLASLSYAKHPTKNHDTVFTKIKTYDDLQNQLQQAKSNGQITMVDFYADWCVACKEMEKSAFSDPRVNQAWQNFNRLQADVTANDKRDKSLEKKLGVIAPPTIIFFDANGNEIEKSRIVGAMSADEFLEHINSLK